MIVQYIGKSVYVLCFLLVVHTNIMWAKTITNEMLISGLEFDPVQ